jgi:hypothetical protein
MARGAKGVPGVKNPGDEHEYIKRLTKAEKSMYRSIAHDKGRTEDSGDRIESRADNKFAKISDAFHKIPGKRKRVIQDSIMGHVKDY